MTEDTPCSRITLFNKVRKLCKKITATNERIDTIEDELGSETESGTIYYKLAKAVYTDNAQTITGAKTFTENIIDERNNPGLRLKHTLDDRTITPSAQRFYNIYCVDNNDALIGKIQEIHETTGMIHLDLHAMQNDAYADSSVLSVVNDVANDKAYATAFHRAYSLATDNDILVKSHVADMPVVHTTGNEIIDGSKNFNSIAQVFSGKDIISAGSSTWHSIYKITTTSSSHRAIMFEILFPRLSSSTKLEMYFGSISGSATLYVERHDDIIKCVKTSEAFEIWTNTSCVASVILQGIRTNTDTPIMSVTKFVSDDTTEPTVSGTTPAGLEIIAVYTPTVRT